MKIISITQENHWVYVEFELENEKKFFIFQMEPVIEPFRYTQSRIGAGQPVFNQPKADILNMVKSVLANYLVSELFKNYDALDNLKK